MNRVLSAPRPSHACPAPIWTLQDDMTPMRANVWGRVGKQRLPKMLQFCVLEQLFLLCCHPVSERMCCLKPGRLISEPHSNKNRYHTQLKNYPGQNTNLSGGRPVILSEGQRTDPEWRRRVQHKQQSNDGGFGQLFTFGRRNDVGGRVRRGFVNFNKCQPGSI